MNKIFTTVFFLFFLSCRNLDVPISPKAVKGVVGLCSPESGQCWDFEKDGPVSLDGEWEFYWGELLEPKDFTVRSREPGFSENGSERKAGTFSSVPGQWQNQGYPSYGCATYRLKILFSGGRKPVPPLSIAMTDTASSYRMYLNGSLVSSNGKPGKSKEETAPFRKHSTFPADSGLFKNGSAELIVQVANFHEKRAGLWDTVRIGPSSVLNSAARQRLVMDLIVFSSLLIMGLYHLGIYYNRKKDKSPLYFGIFCILFSIRTVIVNDKIILDALPFLPYLLIHKIEFFCFYFGSFVFIQFVCCLYPEEFSRKWFILFAFVFLPCSASVILFPMALYTELLYLVYFFILIEIAYIVHAVYRAVRAEKMGAVLFLLGGIFLSAAAVNDILKSMGFIFTPFSTPYGLLIFILFQSIVLSRRFARGFEEAEQFSEELKYKSRHLEETAEQLTQLTENLELKVRERTESLESANRQLENLAESRKRLSLVGQIVSGIVHDIKNPMTAIKAYADLAEDGTLSDQERKEYLSVIRKETDRLSDMAYEILDFSKGSVTLNMAEHNVCDFINEICSFIKMDFEYVGIKLVSECLCQKRIFFDRDRLRRVIINLANNSREALLDGRKDGLFSISAAEDSEFVRFKISDNGPGIPDEVKDTLFDPFSTAGKKNGTGLGLFMCRQIVEQHGGILEWSSERGKGTDFIISIPHRNTALSG